MDSNIFHNYSKKSENCSMDSSASNSSLHQNILNQNEIATAVANLESQMNDDDEEIDDNEDEDEDDGKASLDLSSLKKYFISIDEGSPRCIVCLSYQRFEERLANYQIDNYTQFTIKGVQGEFGSNEFLFTPKRVRWFLGGSLDGIPYVIIGTRYYRCTFSSAPYSRTRDKIAPRKREKRGLNECRKNSKKVNKSTKIDCPAKFSAHRVMIFPKLKMTKRCSNYMKYAKNLIKSNSENLHCEFRFICMLPSDKYHKNHDLGPSSVEKTLPTKLLRHIKTLVNNGITDLDDIYESVEDFMDEKVTFTERRRSKFLCGNMDIVSTVKRMKVKFINIQFEQEREVIRSSLSSWGDESEIFARVSKTDTFLFVYQNEEMKRLYRLYGPNCVLLDAIHRTCDFVWPLYFLIVNTNCDYQVVAFIVAEHETLPNLTESLNVIKSWNPNTVPKYFLVNRPFEDVKGIEAAFPEIKIFVSSFHRIEAWKKKLGRRECKDTNQTEIFRLLEVVANSRTEEEVKNNLKPVIESLKHSSVKCYFLNYWRYYLKRWVVAFWPHDLNFEVNNGVTRLSEDIRYDYINESKCKTVTQIIENLIRVYLPHNLRSYREVNLAMISEERSLVKTNFNFNGFAHWIKDFILKTHFMVTEIMSKYRVKRLSKKKFNITLRSNSKSDIAQVLIDPDLLLLFCDCSEFDRSSVLCKHVFMVGITYSEFQISKIANLYFKEPLFLIDESFCEKVMEHTECANYSEIENHLGGEVVIENNLGGQVEIENNLGGQVEIENNLGGEVEIDNNLGEEIEIDDNLGGEVEIENNLGEEDEIEDNLGGEVEIENHLGEEIEIDNHLGGEIEIKSHLEEEVRVQNNLREETEVEDHIIGEEEEEVKTESSLNPINKEDSLQSQCLSELQKLESMIPALNKKKLKQLFKMLQKFRVNNSEICKYQNINPSNGFSEEFEAETDKMES